jgi:hypothetical protein
MYIIKDLVLKWLWEIYIQQLSSAKASRVVRFITLALDRELVCILRERMTLVCFDVFQVAMIKFHGCFMKHWLPLIQYISCLRKKITAELTENFVRVLKAYRNLLLYLQLYCKYNLPQDKNTETGSNDIRVVTNLAFSSFIPTDTELRYQMSHTGTDEWGKSSEWGTLWKVMWDFLKTWLQG